MIDCTQKRPQTNRCSGEKGTVYDFTQCIDLYMIYILGHPFFCLSLYIDFFKIITLTFKRVYIGTAHNTFIQKQKAKTLLYIYSPPKKMLLSILK